VQDKEPACLKMGGFSRQNQLIKQCWICLYLIPPVIPKGFVRFEEFFANFELRESLEVCWL
jgi:hypothetical protein